MEPEIDILIESAEYALDVDNEPQHAIAAACIAIARALKAFLLDESEEIPAGPIKYGDYPS